MRELGKKIKEHILPDGSRVQVYLKDVSKYGKVEMVFKAKYDGLYFVDMVWDGLVKQIDKHYREHCELKYEPFILVEKEHQRGYPGWLRDNRKFEFSRVFRATKPDGTILEKRFIADGAVSDGVYDDVLTGTPDKSYRVINQKSEKNWVTPYTPEKWTALRRISRQLDMLYMKINNMFEDDQRALSFLDKVGNYGLAALTSGSEKIEKGG